MKKTSATPRQNVMPPPAAPPRSAAKPERTTHRNIAVIDYTLAPTAKPQLSGD